MSGKRLLLLLALLVGTIGCVARAHQSDVAYKPRGNRSEGLIRPTQSGNAIELVSAVADYEEPSSPLPASVAIRFYLKALTQVTVSVRGVLVQQDYWMNEVQPSRGWMTGFGNEFRWPTSDVIQRLGTINSIYQLGVVVCLGSSCDVTDTLEQTVAPAILFCSSLPTSISGYRFTLKPITRENLRLNLYPEVNGSAVGNPLKTETYDANAGVPFNFEFLAPEHDGWYQVQASGQKHFSQEQVSLTIHFYHARTLTP